MSNKYFLNCEKCDHANQVAIKLAGATIDCENCPNTIDVPKLGDLRKLKPTEVEKDARPAKAWGRSNGIIFGIGFAEFLLFVTIGTSLYWYASTIQTEPNYEENLEKIEAGIDGQSDAEALTQWVTSFSKVHLKPWEPSKFVLAKRKQERYQMYSYICFGISAIGLVIIGASVMMAGKQSSS